MGNETTGQCSNVGRSHIFVAAIDLAKVPEVSNGILAVQVLMQEKAVRWTFALVREPRDGLVLAPFRIMPARTLKVLITKHPTIFFASNIK